MPDVEMIMPDLATTESEIRITNWLVEIGGRVQRGRPLLEVETDKAAVEVESYLTGILKEMRARPGDEVAAGEVIAVIEAEGAVTPLPPSPDKDQAKPAAGPAAKPAAEPKKAGGMFARNRLAAQEAAETEHIDLSVAERMVAKRMQRSKQTVPHFYLQRSADAEPMVAQRMAAAPRKIVWDAFFVHAAGKALERFERMCYSFENERLVSRATDAVGVAIDIDNELFVVPVADPASKTPQQISDEIVAAAELLRSGDAEAREIRPANITVTNLGVSNVESFVAIVNPPESAVLAVGKVAPAAVVNEGKIEARNRVSLTLSVDHRVAGGRYAADFLDAIVRELESF